ncbi:hypothetical protein M9H77_13523 [Catharanthus roseus]|uniref:Uncharacterized protein n=1 Tax=Catharanthus roseus TaxID=4058 RepID=A0ACC0BKD8_CATRO|nr:hypothetical protein M9H77_13523 [Catharanthus roseus]
MDESIIDDNSSFYGVVYVRGEVVDFNVEELDRVVLLYLLGTCKPVNIRQVIYNSIVQLNFTKEEPFKKLLFPCLITHCQSKVYSDDIIVNEISEKVVSKKLDVDTKDTTDIKAKKHLARAARTKAAELRR